MFTHSVYAHPVSLSQSVALSSINRLLHLYSFTQHQLHPPHTSSLSLPSLNSDSSTSSTSSTSTTTSSSSSSSFKPQHGTVEFLQQVLLFHDEAEKSDTKKLSGLLPLWYFCITQNEVVLVHHHLLLSTRWMNEKSEIGDSSPHPHTLSSSTSSPIPSVPIIPPVLVIPFSTIKQVVVSAVEEDMFTLDLHDNRPSTLRWRYYLSSVHRKSMIETLQQQYNSHYLLRAPALSHLSAYSHHATVALLSPFSFASSDSPPDSIEAFRNLHVRFHDPHTSLHVGVGVTPTKGASLMSASAAGGSTLTHLYSHPAERFYSLLPHKLRANRQVVYRHGYMFLSPTDTILDAYSANPNRCLATYCLPDTVPASSAEGEGAATAASMSDTTDAFPNRTRKHLVVHMSPVRQLSAYLSLLCAREEQGMVGSGMSLERARADASDLDFQQWSEDVARSIAQHEAAVAQRMRVIADATSGGGGGGGGGGGSGTTGSSSSSSSSSSAHFADDHPFGDYATPQAGMYAKKLNPTGDKAAWVCHRVHIYTKYREIGVMTARRKYLPPYLDTYQEMVFVLYGTANPPHLLVPSPDFMRELESIVDSLSPLVSPVPFHFATNNSNSDSRCVMPNEGVHRTYYDYNVIQARANSLLFSHAQLQWLQTRDWLRSPILTDDSLSFTSSLFSPHYLTHDPVSTLPQERGIVPRSKFVSMECQQLARAFCLALAEKISVERKKPSDDEKDTNATTMGGGGGGGGTGVGGESKEGNGEGEGGEGNNKPADDPIAILFRMQTELANPEEMLRTDTADSPSNLNNTASASTSPPHPSDDGYSEDEEWRARLSRYLAFCVDGGLVPASLTLRKIVYAITRADGRPIALEPQVVAILDRVIDFLLFLKKRKGAPLHLPGCDPRMLPALQPHYSSSSSSLSVSSSSPSSPSSSSLKRSPFDRYVPVNNVIIKLMDDQVIFNPSFSEEVLCQLLATNYFEDLITRTKIGSAPPTSSLSRPPLMTRFLLSLLFKDYSLSLIRAVCGKIVALELDDVAFYPPLIALIKSGSLFIVVYALRTIAFLTRTRASDLYRHRALHIVINHFLTSKNESVLEACLDIMINCFAIDTNRSMQHDLLIRRLTRLLAPRFGGERVMDSVLAKLASLILKLSSVPTVLNRFMDRGIDCHRELLAIIAKKDTVRGGGGRGQQFRVHKMILLQVSACLGTMYVNARHRLLEPRFTSTLTEDAVVILEALKENAGSEQLQLSLNFLIVLRHILKLPEPDRRRLAQMERDEASSMLDEQFHRRVNAFSVVAAQALESKLDLIADEAKTEIAAITRQRERLLQDPKFLYGPNRAEVEGALDSRVKIARAVQKKIAWFVKRLHVGKQVEWGKTGSLQKRTNKETSSNAESKEKEQEHDGEREDTDDIDLTPYEFLL